MATFKHISSKNADYGAAEQYLTFEHDEFTMKPTLDENGRLMLREDYRIATLNCGDEDFAVACMRSNLRYGKNQKREDVKSHHYIISFDPRDAVDNGLTVDRAQALGEEFCRKQFPGHQAIVCTHPDGHNHSGNIHVHIVINSLRIVEVPFLPYMDIIPSDLATFGGEAKRLLQDLQTRNERLFLVTILIMNTATNRQKLENAVFQTAAIAQKYNCALKRLDFQQEEGLMSSLPIGVNQVEIERGLTTSSTAVFVPFTTQELFQGGEALYYGLNALSNNMIMVDRKRLKNPNGLILGTPGSGKSFSAKREMTNAFLITEDDIIVCDPEAEYFPLVQKLGGQVIRISPVSTDYINPLDINTNYSEEENPLTLKSDFILSMCELIVGGKDGLQPVEKTIIDRSVRMPLHGMPVLRLPGLPRRIPARSSAKRCPTSSRSSLRTTRRSSFGSASELPFSFCSVPESARVRCSPLPAHRLSLPLISARMTRCSARKRSIAKWSRSCNAISTPTKALTTTMNTTSIWMILSMTPMC